jgi:hypothetical protein
MLGIRARLHKDLRDVGGPLGELESWLWSVATTIAIPETCPYLSAILTYPWYGNSIYV